MMTSNSIKTNRKLAVAISSVIPLLNFSGTASAQEDQNSNQPPLPSLSLERIDDNLTILLEQCIVGRSYQIETSNDLKTWSVDSTFPADLTSFQKPISLSGNNGFVRLRDLGQTFIPGEIIVSYREPESADDPDTIQKLVQSGVTAQIAEFSTLSMNDAGFNSIHCYETEESLGQTIASLNALPEIQHAERNIIIKLDSIPNDPSLAAGDQWWAENGFGTNVRSVWQNGTNLAEGVVFAVLDTGLSRPHADLDGVIAENLNYDAIENDFNIRDDRTVHASHVFGIIAAQGDNNNGISGLAWNPNKRNGFVTKFLGEDGGTLLDAIRGLDYITKLKKTTHPELRVVNCSWGGSGRSPFLYEAMFRGAEEGLIYVCAAGNNGKNSDSSPKYPAAFDTRKGLPSRPDLTLAHDAIISVASIEQDGSLSRFSNYGTQSVDLGAPGGNVISSVPDNAIASLSGTSMAAPMVTGALVLRLGKDPQISTPSLIQALMNSVTPTASLNGRSATGGRLDIAKFVGTQGSDPTPDPDPDPLEAPSDLVVTAKTSNSVTLTWRDRSSTETGFEIQQAIRKRDFTTVATTAGNVTSFVVTGLTPSVRYRFRVRALRNNESSGYSNVRSIRLDEPTHPGGQPVITKPSNDDQNVRRKALLEWTPVTGATHYRVVLRRVNNGESVSYNVTTNALQLDDPATLVADRQYDLTVIPFNSDQAGRESATIRFRTRVNQPNLLLPAEGYETDDLRPTFTWEAIPGVGTYTIEFARDNEGSIVSSLTQTGLKVATARPSQALEAGRQWFWRVTAKGPQNQNTSHWRRLETKPPKVVPPTVPTLASPTNGATGFSRAGTFRWNASTNATIYRVQVSLFPDFSTTRVDAIISGTSYTVPDENNKRLQRLKKYYWRVHSQNAAGQNSQWSPTRSFTAADSAPGTPGLVSPANGHPVERRRPTFTWNGSNGASEYVLKIWEVVNGTQQGNNVGRYLIADPMNGQPISFRIPAEDRLKENQRYRWTVHARSATGIAGTAAATWDFRTPE